jgi:uncharacterized membrane protein
MASTTAIALLSIAFTVSHLVISHPPVRSTLIARLGTGRFTAMYSALSLVLWVPMAALWWTNVHAGRMLWALRSPLWVHTAELLAVFGVALAVAGIMRPAPSSQYAKRKTSLEVRGAQVITRHPLFMGLGLLCLAHVLVNGWAGDLWFLGSQVLLSVVGTRISATAQIAPSTARSAKRPRSGPTRWVCCGCATGGPGRPWRSAWGWPSPCATRTAGSDMWWWLACREPGPVEVSLAKASPNPLQGTVQVELLDARPVWMECTTEADPEEHHLVESTQSSLQHELVVRGLLPETFYRCIVHAGASWGEVGIQTPALPLSSLAASGEPSGAYTLFNLQTESYTDGTALLAMVDPQGQLRWWYPVGQDLVLDIDAEVERDGGEPFVHLGGGWAHQRDDQPNKGVFRDVDLSGETLLEREAPDFGVGFNHHSERLDDGSYLSLTFHEEALGSSSWYGVGIEQWDESLLWSWSTQPLVEQGVLPVPTLESPYHPNSVSFVTDSQGEAVWLSLYVAKEIWRIDRNTGARTHVFGATGDFVVDPPGDWPYVQHDPDYQGDRVLMYDNGAGRPVEEPYSRVVEYELDLDARTAVRLWEWTEPGWYNPVIGDADYLPSGHVLVAQGFNHNRTPNSDDASELVELRPPDEVVWRATFPSSEWAIFRAQQYDGCALFSNARYCEDVAERLAELTRGTEAE